jgi:hypothetical protein
VSDNRPTPPLAPTPIEPMPEGIELRDLWTMVVSLRRRVEAFEAERVIDTINEHDDRLDGHDTQLERLDQLALATNTWMSGIRHSVDETNRLLRALIERGAVK